MALSGSVSSGNYQGRYYNVSWTATQDIATNTSTISWTLKAEGQTGTWYAERTLKVVVAGYTVFSKTDRVQRYDGYISSGTVQVNHNTEGNASFGISIEAAVYYSSVNCTGSNTFTLNTIPRKSELSVKNGTLNVAQTLTVTRKSNAFTHTIVAACGNSAVTVCEKSSNTSIPFTPPIDWARQNTTGTTVSVLYQISTYSSNSFIGYNEYTVTCTIPDIGVLRPTCSLIISEGASLPAVYGTYMQKLSKLKVKVATSTAYGAAITSISTTFENVTYNGSEFTTGVISGFGTIAISCTVKDARGRTYSYATMVEVTKYSPPTITTLNAYRSTEHGANDDQGEYITLSCIVEYPCYWNSSTWKLASNLKYAKSNDTAYTTLAIEPDSLDLISSTDHIIRAKYMRTFAADTDFSYNVSVDCTDIYGKTATVSTAVSTAFTIMHFPVDGTGIGFGKVVENKGHFEVGQPAKFFNDCHVKGALTHDIPLCNSGYDCNAMLTSGVFYMGASALNKPTAIDGWLEVHSYGSGDYCYQVYKTPTGVIYDRYRSNGTWSNWLLKSHSYIVGRITDFTNVAAGGYIPFTLSGAQGPGFSISGGKIVIGDGVKRVRIYARIGGSASSGRIWAKILINGAMNNGYVGDAISYGTYATACADVLCNVDKGYTIGVTTAEALTAGSGGVGCYIGVENIT